MTHPLLDLGWVVISDVCLRGSHRPSHVSSYKTTVLENGRASNFQPCDNQVRVKEIFNQASKLQHHPALTSMHSTATPDGDKMGEAIFARTANDHKLSPSMEDVRFLKIMDTEFHQDSSNTWVGPLLTQAMVA